MQELLKFKIYVGYLNHGRFGCSEPKVFFFAKRKALEWVEAEDKRDKWPSLSGTAHIKEFTL